MNLIEIIKGLATGFLQGLSKAWWVEITTAEPQCIYYFGPFPSSRSAITAYPEYIEDLNGEGAKGVAVIVRRCQPEVLTIFEE